MADIQYEQKIRDMQKYVPFLESLIKKMKSNRDEKREAHLHKVEMLYGLLTNKDKKLKLETLQKCESVLVKLCEKMERHDQPMPNSLGEPSSSTCHDNVEHSQFIDEMAAPASPSNPEPFVEFHNPIVIPTERRQTPPPPTRPTSLHHNRSSYEDSNLFDRSRNRYIGGGGSNQHNIDHRTTSTDLRSESGGASNSKQSPELFRRRSPNRDRPNRYDEELRKKYETPPSGSSNQKASTYSSHRDYPTTARPRVNTVRNSFTTAVLKSPPLTLDDLKDLMNDPESPGSAPFLPPLPTTPAPVPPPLPVPPPAVMPHPVPAPVVAPIAPAKQDVGIDKSKFDARQNPRGVLRITSSGVIDKPNTPRIDPRSVGRVDPRFSRDVHAPANPPIEAPRHDHKDTKTADPPVRLAFKYNPHPRREGSTKSNDYEQSPRMDDNRGINHLPSVNPSDPRLRNRPMFTPDNNCPSASMPHMNSPVGNLPSPIGTLASPLSPMANFIDPKLNHSMPDNRNSPIYPGATPFFGNFPPHIPQPLMHTPNMFMTPPANRFKPPPQPRTYGEYRKFKQSIGIKPNKMPVVDPKKDATTYGQNHSPLEVTVKPMEFSKETAPSVLDAMYRNTDFKKDAASGVQSFKIPKLKKDPPVVPPKETDEEDWNDVVMKEPNAEHAKNKASSAPKSDNDEDWDDDKDLNKSQNFKHQPEAVTGDEDWDDDDVVKPVVHPAKNKSSVQKSVKKKTEKRQVTGCDSIDSVSDNEDWGQDNYYDSCSSEDYFVAKEDTEAKSQKKSGKDAKTPAKDKQTARKSKPVANKKSAKAPSDAKSSAATPDLSKVSKDEDSSCDLMNDSEQMAEDEEDVAMKSKDQRKRRSVATSDSKPPAKVAKRDAASEDENITDVAKDIEMPQLESMTSHEEIPTEDDKEQPNEDDEDRELPDTIINSDISMDNIIEGKRRTRGSNRFHPAFQTTSSPTKTKSPGVTPPKKKQKTGEKSPEDESQECAVTSTTTTTEPIAEEQKSTPAAKGRRAVAAKKAQGKQEQAAVEQQQKKSVTVEANNSAGSSSKEKDEITKEWLESFLLNLFNPAQMSNSSVLAMLEKVLDPNKFQQVKQILCTESAHPEIGTEAAAATEKTIPEPATPEAIVDAPKPKAKKKKNELDRLNDDIREMFICQGVLTATGRRMCTAISEKENELETLPQKPDMATASTSATAKAACKVASKAATGKGAKAAPKKKVRRAGVFWKGNRKRKRGRGRPRKVEEEDEEEEEEDEGDAEAADINEENAESDDGPLSQQVSDIVKKFDEGNEEEVLKIIVGGSKAPANSINREAIEILDSSSDDVDEEKLKSKRELKKDEDSKTDLKTPVSGVLFVDKKDRENVTKTEEAPVLKAEGNEESAEFDKNALDKREIPKLMPVVMLRRRGRPPKEKLGPDGQPANEFKNINRDMHSQSEYLSSCALCPFVGRHMSNHYVRAHWESEVLISRLPPDTQKRLLQNIGVAAVGKLKKHPNKTLFVSTCAFCDIQNTFTRVGWVDHYGTHTGEYTFKCSACNRRLNFRSEISKHIKTRCPKGQAIRLRSLLGSDKRVTAHICLLCNYIQMSRQNIVDHLLKQHDIVDETKIKELTLLECANVPVLDSVPVQVAESNAKQPRLAGMDCVEPENAKEVTDVERNREIFVSNEQNDVNLDTNIMQFMRDVSFSATDSPLRPNAMSVADRINERLKCASSQGASDHFDVETSHITPSKPQSMADRLSERFSRTPPDNVSDVEAVKPSELSKSSQSLLERFEKQPLNAMERNQSSDTQQAKDDPVEENMESSNEETEPVCQTIASSIKVEAKFSANCSDTIAASTSFGAQDPQSEDDDVILISDGEEETKTVKTSKPKAQPRDKSAPGTSDITEIFDDDDDWEDIETPPSPSCLVAEQKGPAVDSKGRKNKTIIATLNRLYASIVQPKSKGKVEPSEKSGDSENNIDRKKCEANGMQRVNNIGFSRKTAETLKYHCLVEGCSFLYSDIPDGLQNHVIFEHPTLTWNGFCHICNRQIVEGQSIKVTDELKHMQDAHINCPNGNENNVKSPSGAIKIRRLSGDVLSGQIQVSRKPLTPPPLQITSAVSLNKNSDIWKPVTPDKQQKGSVPIVIKSIAMSSSGAPSLLINPSTKPTSPSQSKLKIAKITSIADASGSSATTGSALSTGKDLHPSLKIVNVESQSATKSMLKPWTHCVSSKSEVVAKSMLREISLYALYKCMANGCGFATGNMDYFANHMLDHAQLGNTDKQEAWQSCCYCSVWAQNGQMLAEHISKQHNTDIYQCAYCFYRSCDECNVQTHQSIYHRGNETKILVCFGEKLQAWSEFKKLLNNASCNIDVIACADCTQTFIAPSEFARHLQQHPQLKSGAVYKCSYCTAPNNSIIKNQMIQHLRTVHGIADGYHCVFCYFATKEVYEMEMHMANVHPSNILLCCHRPKSSDDPVKEALFARSDTGVSILSLRKHVDSSLLKSCPFTDEELKDPEYTTCSADIQSTSAESPAVSGLAKSMVWENNACRNTKIVNAAIEIVKNTGTNLDTLYKCGVETCGQMFVQSKSFRQHVVVHSPQNLPCYHCGELFASAVAYTNHYIQHERHRYFCFLCFETDRTPAALALHIAKHHSIKGKSTIVTYALIKGYVNPKRDFFFVCPNSVKAVDVVRFGDRLLKMWERKKWSQMKKEFMPDEMDQLPRQAIFFEELYCATCQYKTKVRTNLYRHLQFHKNEVNVASVDPVNPVPCLNSSEKHFDKMTNLACSSHANKPPSSANGPGTSSPFPAGAEGGVVGALRRVEHVLPEFVPMKNRFVCKTPECKFVTTTEHLFKQHLNAVHANDKNYSCPHCNVVVCANKICTDKVAHHMKFHDTNLYQCKRCGYLHFHKPVMERHMSDKHPNEKTFYFIYNRSEGGVQKTSSDARNSNAEATDEFANEFFQPMLKWQCTLCKTRTATQNQMTAHINITHNIKYRYQCSNCNFGGVTVTSIGDHAQRKHANVVTEVVCFYSKLDPANVEQAKSDTTPLWRRDPNKVKNIRGILMDVESVAPLALPVGSQSPTSDVDELLDIEEDADDVHESLVGLTPESRVCHICSYPAPDIATLRAHIVDKHGEQSKESLDKLFKYVCFHCQIAFKAFAEFRDHWSQVHQPPMKPSGHIQGDHKEGRVAWFTVWRRYRCSKCSQSNEYREISIHHFLEHPKDTFAVRDVENELKCGHCSFEYESDVSKLSDHYKQEHLMAAKDPTTSPVPPSPSTPLTMDNVRDLMSLGASLQFFKCNICHAILHDMNACKTHCARLHDIKKNVPCTVLQGMIYKCPTCQFCSPVEINVARHISNKLRSNNFKIDESLAKPVGVKESLWPFMTLEVIFPNGFVTEKYRLLGTQFGKMNVIENFVKKQQDIGFLEAGEIASPTKIPPAEAVADSRRESGDWKTNDDNKSANDRSERCLVAKPPAANTENMDKPEADGPAEPNIKPKQSNPESVTDERNVVASTSNSALAATKDDNPVVPTPYSFYGNKPEFSDLGSIIANVIVDGVKVMIPAKDFHKVFKQAITLKLQKINVDEKRPDQHEANRSKSARMLADESMCDTPNNQAPTTN